MWLEDEVGEIDPLCFWDCISKSCLANVQKLTRARFRAIKSRELYSLAREIHREAREVPREEELGFYTEAHLTCSGPQSFYFTSYCVTCWLFSKENIGHRITG